MSLFFLPAFCCLEAAHFLFQIAKGCRSDHQQALQLSEETFYFFVMPKLYISLPHAEIQ